ncbi:MAG: DsbA family protein [Patescibacteria group bacterium]
MKGNNTFTKNPNGKWLIATILFGSILVAGALIFVGLRLDKNGLTDEELQTKVVTGIEQYIKDQQNKANQPDISEVEGDFTDDDAVLGDKDAPLTIVEFSDFQCPACRSFYNNAFKELSSSYIGTGKVNLVYRDYPLSFHENALPAAIAAGCAKEQGGDDKFFEIHDKIFDGQNLKGNGTVEITNDELKKYAGEVGLDMKKFNDCFDNQSPLDEILKDRDDADKIGIDATPSFIIGNKKFSGAWTFDAFKEIIEAELAAAE